LLPVAVSQPPSAVDRRHSLQTLERGLDVIQVFSRERPALTLSEVAQLAGITRASARRILLTLQMLGHMRSDGRSFSPTPRLLSLGWAYLSSLSFTETAGLLLEELSDEVNEACSAATLDLPDAVYVARVPTRRVVSINLDVGSRVPATHSSMGRVLLAGLPPEQAAEFVRSQQLVKHNEYTIVDHDALIREIERAYQQGWSIVDQELEIGLRSIAAPIRRGDGRVIAAANISAVSARVSLEEMRTQMLPSLLAAADAISRAVVQQNTSRLGNTSRL
jgi:IclR family transcriptional regulator, pca regulon regulatory protein